MSKIKIDKKDANRILLTELLPYEVPMLFSNDGLYNLVSKNEHHLFFDKIEHKKQPYGIPFNYEIAKSNDLDTRCLSIIHPSNQLSFIDFYQKYDSIIIHLCSKSPFSLRKIKKVAKYSYSAAMVFEEDGHHSGEVEIEPDVLDVETKILKSYFIYNPIDLIYKFYERNEYQRLEQRFNLLWEFDVSKCFYHIYTHSITWAIKDKESAKKNARRSSFENSFDKLMQLSNYNETNGIVVGPEISRIFAEILLQQVDLNVLKKLEETELKLGIDYEIRRYVDDFFVYSNDEKTLETILRAYKKELEFYKLYLNTNKTKKSTTPFITNISVSKRQVKKLVIDHFKELIYLVDAQLKTKAIRPITKPYYLSQHFIKDFQCIVRQNNVTYDVVNKDVVRLLKSEFVKILKDKSISKSQNEFENFLLMFLDIAFYAYSLNINASSTFKIAQIIVLTCKFLDDKNEDFKQTIYSKISRESEFVMTNYHRKTSIKETNIETINLLIPLKKMGDGYLITEKKLREYFNLSDSKISDAEKFQKLNYFQIITLLYYFDDNIQYDQMKAILEKSVVKKFELDEEPFTKSELTCLFFDFVCCPFVSAQSKEKIVKHSKYETTDIKKAVKQIEDKKMWFMNWDIDIDLERVLKKKEWSSAY
jgi:hypothetical protein